MPAPPVPESLIPNIRQDHTEGIHTSSPPLIQILSKSPKLLVLSAGSESSLDKLTACYAEYFEDVIAKETYSQAFLDDLAYTLGSRRTHLSWRSFFIAASGADLQAVEQNSSAPRQKSETPPCLGFIFTGQGAQWYRMGQELMVYPVFQKSIHESDTYLRSIGCTWPVFGKRPVSQIENSILMIARLLYAKLLYKP